MNLIELQRSLRQLWPSGMAAVLETRLHQAQAEPMAPIDLLATLVNDELTRRSIGCWNAANKPASAIRTRGSTTSIFSSIPSSIAAWCLISPPAALVLIAVKMHWFSGPAARAKVISPRASVRLRFCRATR